MKEQYKIVGSGSYRKRPNGSWECRYTLENIITKEKKKKSIYGKLRREVQAKFNTLKNAEIEPQIDVSMPMTLGNWMGTWLSVHKATSIREGTKEKYRQIIDKKIVPALGDRDIRTLDNDDIQTFLNGLSPALGGKQINEVRAVLLSALNKAVDSGMIQTNPAAKTARSYEGHHRIIAMSEKDQAAFLKAAAGCRYELLYRVALATGMRRGELLGLRWEDIDMDAGVIHVQEAITKIGTRMVQGEVKSQSGVRDIPIARDLLPVLRDARGSGLVFQYSTGTPVNPSYVLMSMKALCDKAGIRRYCVKDLRSTFATRAAEKGVNSKTLMALMGHSDVSVTLKYYTDATIQMRKDAIEKIFAKVDG